MSVRFDGRRVLITGASRGIGAAMARRLATEGADVAIVARTLDQHPHLPGSLNEVAADLRAAGATVGVIVADLTDPDDRARIVPEAEAALGGSVEVLVNNAAAAIYQPLVDFPLRRRMVTFEVNVHAPLDLAQAVIPGMVDAGEGWILNLSSASAHHTEGPPFPDTKVGTTIAVYGASKAALNRISNGLAVELHGTGVRVNTVEPRAAVMSEGAEVLVGDKVDASMVESMDEMVEAAVALCDCPADVTGRTAVSLDLIAEWGLEVQEG